MPPPHPKDVIRYMYTDTSVEVVPPQYRKVEIIEPPAPIKRANGEITYRDAIKEALIEEMNATRASYSMAKMWRSMAGAFKLSKGLLETFGRERVSTPPSPKPRFAARRWAPPWSA